MATNNNCNKTPMKRCLTFDQNDLGSPSAKFSTPNHKGKSVTCEGYILFVGQMNVSQNGNYYFDINLQTKTREVKELRIMRNPEAKEEIQSSIKKRIRFNKISDDGKGVLFYNARQGSSYEIVEENLPFPPVDFGTFCTSMAKVLTENKENVLTSAMYDLHVQILWIGEQLPTRSGNPYQHCVMFDTTGHELATIWRESMLQMKEKTWYYVTKLKVEDLFGFKLQTSHSSGFQESGSEKTVELPHVNPYHQRIGYTNPIITINVQEFSGVSVQIITWCTRQKCDGSVLPSQDDPEMGVCGNCGRDVVIGRCKKSISGEVDTNDLTLSFDSSVIDGYFGVDTSASYDVGTLPQLKKRILLLENVVIKYDGKSKKIKEISAQA